MERGVSSRIRVYQLGVEMTDSCKTPESYEPKDVDHQSMQRGMYLMYCTFPNVGIALS